MNYTTLFAQDLEVGQILYLPQADGVVTDIRQGQRHHALLLITLENGQVIYARETTPIHVQCAPRRRHDGRNPPRVVNPRRRAAALSVPNDE